MALSETKGQVLRVKGQVLCRATTDGRAGGWTAGGGFFGD